MSFTKQHFLNGSTARTVELIDGVFVGSVAPITQSRRESMLRDPTGQIVSDAVFRASMFSLIDQVCADAEGTPLFSEDDYEPLCNIPDARKLQPLLDAVAKFNERNPTDPNGGRGLNA